MEEAEREMDLTEIRDPLRDNRATRFWTAVQHGSLLAAVLGVFVLLFAFNTKPEPKGFASLGAMLVIGGVFGAAVAWFARRLIAARASRAPRGS